MPEPPPNWKLPEIDSSKRYDVYCWEPRDRLVLYRNARFKGYVTLFGMESGGGIFVELEQANGDTVFLARNGIIQFCPHGTQVKGEVIRGKESNER